ncbi:MAG: aspartate aminotransferase family protein [Limnochordia bacterium]
MINCHKQYGNVGLVGMLGLLNFDKQYVRAQGTRVWDHTGKEYLDFLGGYGSLNLGHNPPAVIAGMQKATSMPNLLQASLGTMAGALMQTLAAITPGDLQRSFLCNSGAEAVEGGLKLARAATGKHKFIYCDGGFHGKTMGALSVTGREKYKGPFEPLIPGCVGIPYGDLAALEEALASGDVAAFIVEPIQGEGGIIVPPAGYLKKAKELCARHGALIIVDEIQTGFGRTGRMFACEHDEMTPDILILSKSLGGGMMPLGAFVTTDAIWTQAYGSSKNCLLHTSTFGGNTMAAAAGLAAIEYILSEDLPGRAAELGEYFQSRLRELQEKHNLIEEVRGKGLLIGIEFATLNQGALNKLTRGAISELSQEYLASLVAGELQNNYGIITAYTLNNPNVIRLEPPLIVEKEEIDQVVTALDEILSRNTNLLSMTLTTAKNFIGGLLERRRR